MRELKCFSSSDVSYFESLDSILFRVVLQEISKIHRTSERFIGPERCSILVGEAGAGGMPAVRV